MYSIIRLIWCTNKIFGNVAASWMEYNILYRSILIMTCSYLLQYDSTETVLDTVFDCLQNSCFATVWLLESAWIFLPPIHWTSCTPRRLAVGFRLWLFVLTNNSNCIWAHLQQTRCDRSAKNSEYSQLGHAHLSWRLDETMGQSWHYMNSRSCSMLWYMAMVWPLAWLLFWLHSVAWWVACLFACLLAQQSAS